MALTAHDRAFLFCLVASLAVEMKSFDQPRPIIGPIFTVAVRAALIFRGFIFKSFSAFIYVVAFIAFFYLRFFVVFIMLKHRRRTLSF